MIDSAVKELIDEAIVDARNILTKYREKVEGLSALLIEKEEIDKDEFEALMQK